MSSSRANSPSNWSMADDGYDDLAAGVGPGLTPGLTGEIGGLDDGDPLDELDRLVAGLLAGAPNLDSQPPPAPDGLMFVTTGPAPCPYLPGQVEQKLVAMLDDQGAKNFDLLNRSGFRRSHSVAYRPCCPTCNGCRAVRVRAGEFAPSRSQRKLQNRGKHLVRRYARPSASEEHYALFSDYVNARHQDGDMALMGRMEFKEMVEETIITTGLMEWREPDSGELVGACIVDVLNDGLSMVYSYFDVAHPLSGLGTFMILDCIALCRAHSLPHLYLGYWVPQAEKMDYKKNFHPSEVFERGAWRSVDAFLKELDAR